MTDRPSNQPTDIRVHREITLPIRQNTNPILAVNNALVEREMKPLIVSE